MPSGLSIVIPSWNGLLLLQRHLPSVLEAAAHYAKEVGGAVEIIVVDDGSQDSTASTIPIQFPQVRLIRKDHNSGFSAACNTGFLHCQMPVVSLLNNDVTVEKDYFCRAVAHFRDPRTFAVTARVCEKDTGVFATGGRVGRFRRGFWSVYFNYDIAESITTDRAADPLLSIYAVGGFATYDREKLLELGGFCELLSPFHWEDVDISYRAWKRGWTVRYEPDCIAHHEISATIDKHFSKRTVEITAVRNRLLFHWINLHSFWFLASHLVYLHLLLLTRIFAGDTGFYSSFWQALIRFPEARRLRRQEHQKAKTSDWEVARLLKAFYQARPIRIYSGRGDILRHHPGVPSETERHSFSDRGKI